MMDKVKINHFLSNEVYLINRELKDDETFASITLNPTLKWIKFILTDSEPNENKQRVPDTEFDNLIKTGINMPIKMAFGSIKEGHEDSFPIGVITHLQKIKNRIEGLAGLWYRERPDDIDYLKSEFEKGNTPQISWEIPYEDVEIDENGVENLRGITLRAATIVGMPAYAGRTPVFAMASEDKEKEDKTSMEELTVLKEKLAEAEAKIAELGKTADETAVKIKEYETLLGEKEAELSTLREFKAAVDAEAERLEKLESIKTKFTEANISKSDEYFEENEEKLLSLDENSLDFLIQELVAFASNSEEEDEDAEASVKVPNIKSKDKNLSSKELAEELRKRFK